jgi:nucleoside-diphosphate-sugar epimerase
MPMWIDVRDTAVAHVNAIEKPEFGGKRVYFTEDYGTNRAITDAIRNNFPEYKKSFLRQVGESVKFAGYDNTRAKELLGKPFITVEQSTIDQVKSLKQVGV